MQKKTGIMLIGVVIVAFAMGYFIRGGGPSTHMNGGESAVATKAEAEFWTCSMHPQIRQPGPGQCPICAMDLIPVYAGGDGDEGGERQLKLSARAVKLAEIQSVPAERKFVSAEIRMDGKVNYDETRLSYITAWVPGRIERLYVDYTGVRVNKGDHMVSLYSPDLLTAQQELLLGLKMLKARGSKLRESTGKNVEASREKLRLWGMTKTQIRAIERSGKISDRTTIYAPTSGIVIQKNGFDGMYVDTGTRIYTVADLAHVWIMLDAYESDLMWIRYGQEVEFETTASPGEVFKGRITFIDPILNPETRTVKVRVNVENPEGKLKPEMFVSARVYPRVASGGRVMDRSLAGKWICPMHPEIVKDKKAQCDLCGMDLVKTESQGYVAADVPDNAPIVIPASAPLITGKRAVVYVEVPGKDGVFEGREIVLGPRAGDYYIVNDGLQEGERVVVNGNFKIDSAVQILAKPSMMSPEGGAPVPGHDHGAPQKTVSQKTEDASAEPLDVPDAFKTQIDDVVSAYYKVHQALSRDNLKDASEGSRKLIQSLTSVDMALLKGDPHMLWMAEQKKMKTAAEKIAGAKDIGEARIQFEPLSDSLYSVTKKFGTSGKMNILRFHCPMAMEGKGAYWLQSMTGTENPYYGSMMFKCGSQVETISSGDTKTHPEGHVDE